MQGKARQDTTVYHSIGDITAQHSTGYHSTIQDRTGHHTSGQPSGLMLDARCSLGDGDGEGDSEGEEGEGGGGGGRHYTDCSLGEGG
jgi:hypothetical protein